MKKLDSRYNQTLFGNVMTICYVISSAATIVPSYVVGFVKFLCLDKQA